MSVSAAANPAADFVAIPASSQAPATAALDDSTLLLLSVDLNGLTLSEGLAAYGDPADPLVPMGEFSRLLEVSVDVYPKERKISGRVGEAQRLLLVDLDSNTARLGAQDMALKPGDVVVTDRDIYLRLSLIVRLLPVAAHVDSMNQVLSLKATEKLPVQGRLERLARRRQEASVQTSAQNVMTVPAPYRLASPPAFDVALGAGLESTLPKQMTGLEVRTAADLLYTDFQGYFATDESGTPQTAQFLFQRQSATGLLGPLKARTISAGDVYTPALSLGPRSLDGRGVFISTIPRDQGNVFHQIDLRGDLPLGYDIELYLNDILSNTPNNTPNKGRYEFLNVPLKPGVNVIRIVMYGPRGERVEETRIINLGGAALEKGEANFELGLVDQERPLLDLTTPQASDISLPNAHGLRAVANLNYGVTSNLTVNLGGAVAPTLNDQKRKVLNLGARTSLFGVFTQLDLAEDSFGGRAAALGLAGQYGGFSATLHHAIYQNGFVDEGGPAFAITRVISARTEFTVDGALAARSLVLPVSFRTQRIAYANGDQDFNAAATTSATMGAFYASGGFEYQGAYPTRGAATQRLSGLLALSSFRNFRTQIRATLDYDILPNFQLQSLALTVDRKLNEVTTLRLGVGENLQHLGQTNFTASTSFRTQVGDLSFGGNYNNADKSWRVQAQFNFGLGYDPATRRYEMGPTGPASSGSVLLHAFVDDNGNGRFDPGEDALPNVGVQGGVKEAFTGADGRVMIRNAGPGPSGQLHVDLDKVNELSLTTPPTTIAISPRPGGLSTVEYPIRPTGEILVNVKLRRDDGQTIGLSAVSVRVQGDNGYEAGVTTESDGGAYFESLPVGAYTVTLDPEQAKRLRMNLKAPGQAKVERGGFAKPVELEVTFAPAPEKETG